jgi:Ca2+-binding EF-hand superfamily protein
MKLALVAVMLCAPMAFVMAGEKGQEQAQKRDQRQKLTLEEIFQAKDKNNSGSLTRDEMKLRVKKKKESSDPDMGKRPSADVVFADEVQLAKAVWKSFFEQADRNGSDDLDFNEWLSFRTLRRTAHFNAIDANDDGEMTFGEYRRWRNRKLADAELDEFEIDERRQRQKKHFARVDANDDRVVTLEAVS